MNVGASTNPQFNPPGSGSDGMSTAPVDASLTGRGIAYIIDSQTQQHWEHFKANFSAGTSRSLRYEPTRLVAYPHSGFEGSLAYFSTATPYIGGDITVVSSIDGTAAPSFEVSLPASLVAGSYNTCWKPWHSAGTGVFAPLIGREVVLFPRTSFSPTFGIGGEVTTISFNGAQDGDFVVLKNLDCNEAHTVANAADAAAKRAITGGQLTTLATMTVSASLRVCYATLESGGNSADDFTSLDSYFYQTIIKYNPMRTMFGSGQIVRLSGAEAGDKFILTKIHNCTAFNAGSTLTATDQHTAIITATGADPQSFLMTSGSEVGVYKLCYMPSSGIQAGAWVEQHGIEMTVSPRPSFTPPIAVAGMKTAITFTGSREGDLVVLTSLGCVSGVSSTALGRTTLGKTNVTQGGIVYTDPPNPNPNPNPNWRYRLHGSLHVDSCRPQGMLFLQRGEW
jgi:hypothetical protein